MHKLQDRGLQTCPSKFALMRASGSSQWSDSSVATGIDIPCHATETATETKQQQMSTEHKAMNQ